jgi:hypothetical protein
LLAQAVERRGHHADVGQDEEDGADGDLLLRVEVGSDAQSQRPADAAQQIGHAGADEFDHLRRAARAQHPAREAEQPAQRVLRRAAALDVFDPGQALLDIAKLFGGGLPGRGPAAHAQPLHRCQRAHADRAVERQGQPRGPVLDQQQAHRAEDQHAAGHDADDKLGEEIGQFVHVAVHTLDQFAGGVHLMKGHIQAQQMFGQRGAQRIGGAPAHVDAQVGCGDRDHAPGQAGGDKGEARVGQRREVATALRGVDKVADDLRVDQLQRDAGHQQRRQ